MRKVGNATILLVAASVFVAGCGPAAQPPAEDETDAVGASEGADKTTGEKSDIKESDGAGPTNSVAGVEPVAADAEGLKSVFAELQQAIRAGDTARAAEMTRALLPGEESLQVAIKDDEAVKKVVGMYQAFTSEGDEAFVRLFATDPKRSEMIVHAATTEELISYQEGTPAFNEFPGGARQVAESVLQPEVTFYEIELVEPGEERGMKYHMFFHDGKAWKMLGPIWREL